MTDQESIVEDAEESDDPLEFLRQIMNGEDPRSGSELVLLANTIDEFSDGSPSKKEWNGLLELIQRQYSKCRVPISSSLSAGKTLAEYKHSKKKQSESGSEGGASSIDPLTDEEVRTFLSVFDDEF